MRDLKAGKLAAASLTLLILLLGLGSIPSLSQASVPGLYYPERSLGVSTWTHHFYGEPHTSLLHGVWVVDHDIGISLYGESHIVTVTYPGGAGPFELYPLSQCAPDGCWYEYFDFDIDQNNLLAYSGDYTFRVERADDPDSFSEWVDHLEVAPVGMLDMNSFSPKHPTPQAITAFFDDVYVNGELYDDFSAGLDHNRWWWDDRWTTLEDGQARFDVDFNPGRGSYSMTLNHHYIAPVNIKQLGATVRVTHTTGDLVQARIINQVVRDHSGDISAQLRIRGNQATYLIGVEQPGGNHYRFFSYVDNAVLGPVTTGNRYELSLAYDEGSQTYTFSVRGLNDSVNYSASYTLSGSISAAANPNSSIGVAGWVRTSTTPVFDWAPVSGASHYRVRIYGLNDATLWRGWTKQPPYQLPPGILKPSSIYKYRIEAMGDHQWFDWDNVAITDRNLTRFITTDEEAQAPYVDLHSIGAETWSETILGDTVSFFIKVHDAQGVPENIASVTVQLPGGDELDLHLDRNEGPNRGVYRGSYFKSPLPAGDYVFTATDRDNNTHSATNYLNPNPIAPTPLSSLRPLDNALLDDTAVAFEWDPVPGADFYEVKVYDQDLKELFTLRNTENNAYLPAGVLKEGAYYRYRIYSRRGFFEDFANAGASSPPGGVFDSQAFFTTANTGGASLPTIDIGTFGVAIWKGPHPNGIDTIYNLELSAQVSDGDGVPEGIREVVVEFPDGTTMPLKYINSPTWGFNYFDDVTLTSAAAIQAGEYKFTVTDFDGNTAGPVIDTLTEDDIAAAIGFGWATITHPADGTTLDTTTPTIAWTPPADAEYCRVRIQNAWGSEEVFFSDPIPVTTTALTLDPGILQTNRNYSIRVYSFREPIEANVQVYSEPAAVSQDRVHISIPGTVTGTNIEVRPLDQNTGAAVATLTFDQVTSAGTTTVASFSEGVPPPSGLALGTPPTYYEITTTATYAGNIEVCLDYSGVYFENPYDMDLFHYTGHQWENITTSHDLTDKIICGQVNSLSPFAILEPKYCKGDLDGDGDVDGRDLWEFAVSWATPGDNAGDLNNDGEVNPSDLILFLNNFGKDDCAAVPAH